MPDTWLSTFPGYKSLIAQTKKVYGRILQTGRVPQHIGFIMDGNRRYARKSKIEVKEGHNAGSESMAPLLELCYECGVDTVTVYAFSIENFNRSDYEVSCLMSLAKAKFRVMCEHGELAEEYGVRIRILGNTALLPQDVLEVLRASEEITKNNTRATLNVCFPYTSRDEMTEAIKAVVGQARDGLALDEISAETIDANLYTRDCPPLDLVVRTSNTNRLSDFLLWQTVNEAPRVVVEFVNCLWPEFGPFRMAWVLLKWSYLKTYSGAYRNTEDRKDK
ncbi:hypothetical protein BABINDRAFT_176150 [Babjeviella inositovora NRRL Y-12698]|uniref:Alkyl transferase n=1 Tax=Babjeviella inositovora NRRL Y-12698 TaxID=984486 RepID=A0A1E3QSV4_9ASCO|nr:uncharacterized protein BABINDRAFT_176150 [Babjeviella inositovora NRRL Y-12698]ODQ79997.1 hypothetical protein BABINDRAFT_176150 [Babjeviella inositovora NRRL Y-12698]